MQSREEKFDRMFFPESVVKEAALALAETVEGETSLSWTSLTTRTGNVTWNYDNDDEFFVDYSPAMGYGYLSVTVRPKQGYDYNTRLQLSLSSYPANQTTVTVDAPARATLLRPFAVLRAWAEKNPPPVPVLPQLPPPPPLKIFIGHGRSHDWRDLKDALQDHHGYDVETFESRPRAGYTIPDVIEGMACGNALALMVLTPEDEQLDGSVRARENVVHEVGYFQGKLGSKRAILLMQEGVNEFSNIHGIVHVPYKNIREVTGEVLAIIKREFPHLSNVASVR
ncbi:nucleotide-binding protein [Pseudarthrobacter sp. NPDC089323]